MATLSIPDPILKRLRDNAAARQLSLEAYLIDLAAKDIPPLDATQQLAAWDAFVLGMSQWAQRHLPAGHVVDDSRESIYEGRGE